jgi:hypothetical protein
VKQAFRPVGTIEKQAERHSVVPTGLKLPFFPICPAVNCWANLKSPYGTNNRTSICE